MWPHCFATSDIGVSDDPHTVVTALLDVTCSAASAIDRLTLTDHFL
jgi:hypothetical protein